MSAPYPMFPVQFASNSNAIAMRVPLVNDARQILYQLGIVPPRPVLFLTGGASAMSEQDIARTRQLIQEVVAKFAQQHKLVVIDGGTDAGIMQMIADARQQKGYDFPLIGVAPRLLVEYPGYSNPKAEATLKEGHSHFVLVESDAWGGESQTIVDLTRTLANQTLPKLGMLINGGKIAEQDVYFATARGNDRVPILVVEGTGRKADELSNAFKTGVAENRIIRAIVAGGDIRIISLFEGLDAAWKQLAKHFGVTA